MEVNKNIFLIGFMGCGKSTIARQLAKNLSADIVEMDETIEAEAGMSINEIFEVYGETYFRDLESQLIGRITLSGGVIVSCGGGAILRQENVDTMRKNGQIIYLSATPETIYERVRFSTNRPLLNGNMNVNYITSLMEKRLPLYKSAADKTIFVDMKNIEEITKEIISIL